jgi:hypothetical protein
MDVVRFSKRGRPASQLRNWLQVLTRDRLDNVLAEHLNVTASITGALLCVIERALAARPQKTGCVRLRSNISEGFYSAKNFLCSCLGMAAPRIIQTLHRCREIAIFYTFGERGSPDKLFLLR